MKADLFLHGTSLKAAQGIIKHGFDAARGKAVWNVSAGKNYFLSVKRIFKEEFHRGDGDKIKESFDCFLGKAFQQAESNVARDDSRRRVVFLLDLAGIEYGKDQSCYYTSAVQVDSAVPVDRIKKIWIDSWDVTCMLPFWKSRLVFHPMTAVPKTKNPFESEIVDFFIREGFVSDADVEWEEIAADKLNKLKNA